MFRLLLEKELHETIRTTKFAVTFGVCSVLILLAFFVGARNYQVSQTEFEAAQAENIKQMEGLTEWRRIDHRVFLPPQPLAALVSGISNDVGRTTEMSTRGELRSENSRFNEDPIFAVFRFLDLEFIFSIVLSLFAILFAYDAINGEKERGTLRLSFSNPIPRDRYVLSKLSGAFLALGVPLLIPILLGSVLLPVLGVPMTGASWSRLALVVVCGYLYLGVFLTLSVFVSALTQNSSSSFLLLLVVWILVVLIVPRTAVLISGRSVDVPSIDKVNFDKSRFAAQLWREDMDKLNQWQKENKPPEDDWQGWMTSFVSFMREQRDERAEQMNEFGGRLNEERQNRERVQQRLALAIARISPTAVFSLASTDLAGTSLALKQRYTDAANRYQESYAQFISEKDDGAPGFSIMIGGNDQEEPEPIDPYELPAFDYKEPAARELVSRSLLDVGLLVLFNITFFVGAFVAFLRYDVR